MKGLWVTEPKRERSLDMSMERCTGDSSYTFNVST